MAHSYTRLFQDTVDPTVNDDGTQGYEVGDWWLNTVTPRTFQLMDATTGAAIWQTVVIGLKIVMHPTLSDPPVPVLNPDGDDYVYYEVSL